MVTGGRERIVAQLVAAARDMGVEPLVIAYDPDAPDRRLAVDAPVLPLDRRAPGFAARLDGLLADQRIDLIHAQGHISAALARRTRVPIVSTLHVALGGGWRWAPAIRAGLRRSRVVTAVSSDLARRFRLLAGEIETIPPAVAIGDVERQPRDIFTIGIAARLHPVKRHADALAALRALGDRGVAARLRIAGQGALEPRLRAAATEVNAVFDGDVADMPRWLAGRDAFVLPSDHEGTPLALMEAIAAGLPCVATRVGGVPALVGDAALLVERRRPAALADALERLARDPALRARLGAASKERMRGFSLAAQATAYRRCYDRAIDGAPSS